jgi:hypothetical protein
MTQFNFIQADGTQTTSSFSWKPVNYPIFVGNNHTNADVETSSVSPQSITLVPNFYKVELLNETDSVWYITTDSTGSVTPVSGSTLLTGSFCAVTWQPISSNYSSSTNTKITIQPIYGGYYYSGSFVLQDTLTYTTDSNGSLTVNLLPIQYKVTEWGNVKNTKYVIQPSGSVANVNTIMIQSSFVSVQITPQNQAQYSYPAAVTDLRYIQVGGAINSASFALSSSYATTSSVSLNSVSSSWAPFQVSSSYATTASYSNTSTSASWAPFQTSGSYATTSSYSNTSTSASNATSASFAVNSTNAVNASVASGVSNGSTANVSGFNGVGISSAIGPVVITPGSGGSISLSGPTTAQTINATAVTSSLFGTASVALNSLNTVSSSYANTSSVAINALKANVVSSSVATGIYAASGDVVLTSVGNGIKINSNSDATISSTSGNVTVTPAAFGSINLNGQVVASAVTSSLFGTASVALNTISSSYAKSASVAPNYIKKTGDNFNGTFNWGGIFSGGSGAEFNLSSGATGFTFGSEAGFNPDFQIQLLNTGLLGISTPSTTIYITGSVIASASLLGNVTGSLLGTSSYASTSLTSSYVSGSGVVNSFFANTITATAQNLTLSSSVNGSGTGGNPNIAAANGNFGSGTGGTVVLTGGNGSTAGGNITMTAGNGTAAAGGNITLIPGTGPFSTGSVMIKDSLSNPRIIVDNTGARITGSLFGSASFASNATSASWAPPIASNFAISASFASSSLTTSYANALVVNGTASFGMVNSYANNPNYAVTVTNKNSGSNSGGIYVYQESQVGDENHYPFAFGTGGNNKQWFVDNYGYERANGAIFGDSQGSVFATGSFASGVHVIGLGNSNPFEILSDNSQVTTLRFGKTDFTKLAYFGVRYDQGFVAYNYYNDFGTLTTPMLTINSNGNGGNGFIGINTANTCSARLHVIDTAEQLRLGNSSQSYFSTTVNSSGSATFNLVGTGSTFTFNQPVTASAFQGTASYSKTTATASFVNGRADLQAVAGSNPFQCEGTASIAGITKNFYVDNKGHCSIGVDQLGANTYSDNNDQAVLTLNFQSYNPGTNSLPIFQCKNRAGTIVAAISDQGTLLLGGQSSTATFPETSQISLQTNNSIIVGNSGTATGAGYIFFDRNGGGNFGEWYMANGFISIYNSFRGQDSLEVNSVTNNVNMVSSVSSPVYLATGSYLDVVSSNYTLANTDNGMLVSVGSGSKVTVTVPSGLSQGFACSLFQSGSGQLVVTGSGGTQILNRAGLSGSAGQWSIISLVQIQNNSYLLQGDLA